MGHIPLVKHIIEEFPPSDAPEVYSSPQNGSSLLLAMESVEPELVWMILDKGLASSEEINKAWSKATSHKSSPSEKHSDVIHLLMRYGGFTPPPTPSNKDSPSKKIETEKLPKKSAPSAQKSEASGSSSANTANAPLPEEKKSSKNSRGGYRGQGRGKGRGRGRGGPQSGQL